MLNPDLPGPKFIQLFAPVLKALSTLGGSARPGEVCDQMSSDLAITDEIRSVLLDSVSSRFDNMVHWARYYLVKAGHIDSSRRVFWSLTEQGRAISAMTHDQAMELFKTIHSKFGSVRTEAKKSDINDDETDLPPDNAHTSDSDYQTELLTTLQELSPEGFERFCQRIFRESGFQEVSVTGRSGDGGIDGNGVLEINPLMSFKVLFPCKRYRGSVSPSQVRDFRGAMMGRADEGIIITNGTFTS